ncbi:MAG: ribosome hibernation-promoting factor, HPF/YfiA family [Thermoanaerobaculia bacterium]
MNVEYVGRHVRLNQEIREFAERKLRKVIKFLEEPVEVRITLEEEKHREIVEVHIAHRFGVLQAREQTDALLDALNLAVDKLETQARRARKKFMDRRRRGDRAAAGTAVPEEESTGQGDSG